MKKLPRKFLSILLIIAMLVPSGIEMLDMTAASENYETAYFPMDYLNITNGYYSTAKTTEHRLKMCVDSAGKDSGKDVVYAPFSGYIKKLKTSVGTCVIESAQPVYWADGSVDYMHVLFYHSDNLSEFGLYVGKYVYQGESIYREGTAGYATGNHIHMEVGRGKYPGTEVAVGSTYKLRNEVAPESALFVKSTTVIINTGGLYWKTAGGSITPPSITYASIHEGEYKLQNANGKYLGVDAGGNKNGNVHAVNGDGSAEQNFRIKNTEIGNQYYIKNLANASQFCVNAYTPTNSLSSQSDVRLWDENTSNSKYWGFEDAGGGYYYIRCMMNPQFVLTADGYNYPENVTVLPFDGRDTQKWKLVDNSIKKPTWASIHASRTEMNVGESIYFEFNSDTADSYTIGIDRNNERILTQGFGSGKSFTYTCDQPGKYSAYVTVSNSAGGLDSNRVYWTVIDEVRLAGISVKNPPVKTTYYIGEEFDFTGLILNAEYSDGSVIEVEHGLVFNTVPFDIAGPKTIRITYQDKTTTLDVNVIEAPLYGDANQDGVLDLTDVYFVLEQTGYNIEYDFDEDGELTAADARVVYREAVDPRVLLESPESVDTFSSDFNMILSDTVIDTLTRFVISIDNNYGTESGDIYIEYDPAVLEYVGCSNLLHDDTAIMTVKEINDHTLCFSFTYLNYADNNYKLGYIDFNNITDDETVIYAEAFYWSGSEKPQYLLEKTINGESDHVHSFIEKERLEATCSQLGCIYYECECFELYVEYIPMLEHTPGSWEVVKEPQVGIDGLQQLKCTDCGEVIDEKVIPALPDASFILGDANGDGEITASDARIALRISAGLDTLESVNAIFEAVDFNSDKEITASDARKILRKAAGLE